MPKGAPGDGPANASVAPWSVLRFASPKVADGAGSETAKDSPHNRMPGHGRGPTSSGDAAAFACVSLTSDTAQPFWVGHTQIVPCQSACHRSGYGSHDVMPPKAGCLMVPKGPAAPPSPSPSANTVIDGEPVTSLASLATGAKDR